MGDAVTCEQAAGSATRSVRATGAACGPDSDRRQPGPLQGVHGRRAGASPANRRIDCPGPRVASVLANATPSRSPDAGASPSSVQPAKFATPDSGTVAAPASAAASCCNQSPQVAQARGDGMKNHTRASSKAGTRIRFSSSGRATIRDNSGKIPGASGPTARQDPQQDSGRTGRRSTNDPHGYCWRLPSPDKGVNQRVHFAEPRAARRCSLASAHRRPNAASHRATRATCNTGP